MLRTVARQIPVTGVLLELEPRDHPGLGRLVLRGLLAGLFFGWLRERGLGEAKQQPRLVRRKVKRLDAVVELRDLHRLAEGSHGQLPELARPGTVRQEVERRPVFRPTWAQRRSGVPPPR